MKAIVGVSALLGASAASAADVVVYFSSASPVPMSWQSLLLMGLALVAVGSLTLKRRFPPQLGILGAALGLSLVAIYPAPTSAISPTANVSLSSGNSASWSIGPSRGIVTNNLGRTTTITNIQITGEGASDYSILGTSTCTAGTVLTPTQSCTINLSAKDD